MPRPSLSPSLPPLFFLPICSPFFRPVWPHFFLGLPFPIPQDNGAVSFAPSQKNAQNPLFHRFRTHRNSFLSRFLYSRTFRSWNRFKFKGRFNCFNFSDYIVWIFKSNRLIRITKLRRIAKKRGIFSRWTNFNNYSLINTKFMWLSISNDCQDKSKIFFSNWNKYWNDPYFEYYIK